MPLLRDRHEQEREKRAKVMAELAREAPNVEVVVRGTPAGDERRLRGIPAIGRGVAGAIPGSRPDVTSCDVATITSS